MLCCCDFFFLDSDNEYALYASGYLVSSGLVLLICCKQFNENTISLIAIVGSNSTHPQIKYEMVLISINPANLHIYKGIRK